MTNELSVLIETLQKKEDTLRKILEVSEKQLEMTKSGEFDEDLFDKCFEEKDELINELNRLDDGFDGVYNKIKVELKENLSDHAPQVASLQQLIKATIDLGSEIHNTEQKVKNALPGIIADKRKNLISQKSTAEGVTNYYRASHMMDIQDSYFMDHKQ